MFLFQIAETVSNNLFDSLGLLLFGVFLIGLTSVVRKVFKLEK